MALLLLLASTARAHPFATRETAHRVQVAVTAEAVHVEATLEVPVAAQRPDVQSLEEVATGLVLEVDGAFVPLRLDPERPPRTRLDSHALLTRVHLTAPAPGAGEHILRLTDHNYPDLPGWFAWTVGVGPLVEVLPPLAHGEGAWQAGDAHRTITLHLQVHEGPAWWAQAALTGQQLRPAREALRRPIAVAWWSGRLRPPILIALGLAALGIGATIGLSGGARHAGRAAAGIALLGGAVAATLLPFSGLLLALVGVATLAVGMFVERPLPALGLAAPGVVLAGGVPGSAALLALLVAIGILAGVVAGPRESSRVLGGVAALLGLLLALRGVGTWLA